MRRTTPHLVFSGAADEAYTLSYITWNGTAWVDSQGLTGNPQESAFGVLSFSDEEPFCHPHVFVHGESTYLVWYWDSTGVMFSKDEGDGFSEPEVGPAFDYAYDLFDATIDTSGVIHVIFQDDWGGGGSGVYYSSFRDGSWGTAVEIIASSDGFYPQSGSLSLDADNNPVVALSLATALDYSIDVYLTHGTEVDQEVQFGSIEAITTDGSPTISNDNPVLRITQAEQYLVWSRSNGVGASDILFLEKGEEWNSESAIILDSESDTLVFKDIDMEIDSNDNPNIVWARADASESDSIISASYIYRTLEEFSEIEQILQETIEGDVESVHVSLTLDLYNAPCILLSDISFGSAVGTVYFAKLNTVLLEEDPACGDGSVDEGEQCNDSNTTSGDGCSATCQFETSGTSTCNQTEFSLSYSFGDPSWWDLEMAPPESMVCTWEQTQGTRDITFSPVSTTIPAASDTAWPLTVTTDIDFETDPTDESETYGARVTCGSWTSEEITFLAGEKIECCGTPIVDVDPVDPSDDPVIPSESTESLVQTGNSIFGRTLVFILAYAALVRLMLIRTKPNAKK